MGWVMPVLSAISAITGAVGSVNSMQMGERAEDLANEQARDQRDLGAASLLEQKNFNTKQLALQSQAPSYSFGSNFATDPEANQLGEDNLNIVPGSANSLLKNNNVVTWY